jgi:hypothetical protein
MEWRRATTHQDERRRVSFGTDVGMKLIFPFIFADINVVCIAR